MPLRDPEVKKLLDQGETLQQQAERLLTQLEDHVEVLRTYVDSATDDESVDDAPDQEREQPDGDG